MDEPRTRADDIRNMTDEELAEVFSDIQHKAYLKRNDNGWHPAPSSFWLEWLRSKPL